MSNKVFIIQVDGTVLDECYGSLKSVAEAAGISYWTVCRKWKGRYERKGKAIQELTFNKNKARGKSL